MAKIVKGLLGLIGLLVVIAVIAVVVVANNLGGIIKSGINDHGASVVGVPVSVSDVAINFLAGTASISDLHSPLSRITLLFSSNSLGFINNKST